MQFGEYEIGYQIIGIQLVLTADPPRFYLEQK